jgi:hypothetical protein
MSISRPCRAFVLCLAAAVLSAAPSLAQATRTWVSGVGDDVNPCSRTAPCKTFAGAISKTAAQGQINVLDPGAYGALTITKSITVDAGGMFAGVLSTLGSSGIIINAAATDKVVLRGLTFDGAGTGAQGVRILAAGTVVIEDCVINNFAQRGIDAQPSTGMFLFVSNTTITNNNVATNGGGILLKPSGAGSVRASLDNVRSERNLFGLRAENNTETVVRDSVFTGNQGTGGGFGVTAVSTAGGNVQINLDNVTVSNNVAFGLQANGLNAIIRAANSMITNNNGGGVSAVNTGQTISFGNNRVLGNNGAGDGSFTSTPGEI